MGKQLIHSPFARHLTPPACFPCLPAYLKLPDVNLRRSLLKFARMSDPPISASLPSQVILFT